MYTFLHLLLLNVFYTATSASLACRPRTGGTPVPLGVFMPRYSPDSDDMNFVPAIAVALNSIHNHSCILNGFKLELIYKDTNCKTSLGMKALFDLIASRPRPVAIFGGFCTEVNEPVAMALKFWEIVQLSYGETHAKFATADSQELYPTFFRIVPGDRNLNNAKCKLIEHFKWKKVGTVKQSDEPRRALPHESLTTKLEHINIKVIYTAGVTRHEIENIGSELDELKRRDVRIIVMDVAEDMASTVLCQAYSRNLYGDNYVWILPGYHSNNWMWKESVNCSREQMESVLESHFVVEFAPVRKDDPHIVGGKKASHVWKELSAVSENIWQGYLYDGMWTLAIALSQALGQDANFKHEKLLSAINNSSFEGVTGRVRFENNERLGLVDISQWKNGTYIYVGHYNGASEEFTMEKEAIKDWTAPLDATIIERRSEYVSSALFAVMSLLALIGISLALIFLFVNLRYRNHRFIKMSSPNLNNIIIFGSILTFAYVILLGVDTRILSPESFVMQCYVKTWTLSLGFTLAFGAMFSKTWRVHSIFTNIRMDRKAIKDAKLFLILAALVLIDVVVLTLWAIISPFSLSRIELPQINSDSIVIIPEVERCQSVHSVYFQAVLYVFKGILMILGCFLAWETRHVNVPALNDSKYIGMSVYNVVVMSILGLSISVILQERVNEAFALACFFIIFSTTLTLCLVFVPKIIELARNPQGDEPRGYRRGLMKSVVAKPGTPNQKENEKDLLSRAESDNQLRRRYLHQKSSQLWDLLEKLREMGDTQFLQQDWCFAMTGGGDSAADPLLSHRPVNSDTTAEYSNDRLEWRWVDPEEPSTML